MSEAPTLRGGRYVTRGLLGEGGQGVTYDALDTHEDRAVAIKRFDVRGARSWKDVELAEREARVLATLDHPMMPRYLDRFEEDGALYLVMEKIEGQSLDAIVRSAGPRPEAEVRRFLACADNALTYLHGRSSPVVHRDVKPRNVIRRPDGTYVLVDFGAVSERMSTKGASTVVGTMGYMAPEQFQGRAMTGSDVYAVGATALAALTGKEPDTLPHVGLRLDVEGALAGRASPDLVAAIAKMVEPDPDRRAKSVGEALAGGGARTSVAPPAPSTSPAVRLEGSEDEVVRSIRKLLWVLWGLGWVIVPVALKPLQAHALVPIVMFSALAALLVVTWHKGALLRALLRKLNVVEAPAARARVAEVTPRVRLAESGGARVAPATTAHEEELAVSDTEVAEPKRARRRA